MSKCINDFAAGCGAAADDDDDDVSHYRSFDEEKHASTPSTVSTAFSSTSTFSKNSSFAASSPAMDYIFKKMSNVEIIQKKQDQMGKKIKELEEILFKMSKFINVSKAKANTVTFENLKMFIMNMHKGGETGPSFLSTLESTAPLVKTDCWYGFCGNNIG
jgi:hypothetical protein